MKTVKVGRGSSNDVVLNNPSVSGQHALLTIRDGETFLRDLNSTNGTFVNGKKISHEVQLKPGDTVQLGSQLFDWTASAKAFDNATKISAPNPTIHVGSVSDKRIIGRDQNCSIVLAKDEVSRNHAFLVKKEDGQIWVIDNQSTNGTFVNGARISECALHAGDVLTIANKYRVAWENEFGAPPVSERLHTKRPRRHIGAIVASVIVVLALGAAALYAFLPWSADKVYATYKSSVVLIRCEYGYRVVYKGESIEKYPIIGEYNMINHSYSMGTGFFISQDGKIMTNAHVATDEYPKPQNLEEERDQLREKLAGLVYLYFQQHKRNLNAKGVQALADLFEIAKNVELQYELLDMRVARNDTYVSTYADFLPCTIVKISTDENLDVAILQLNSKKTPEDAKIVDVTKPAKPKNMKLGKKVYTIGFPKGFDFGETQIGLEANNQCGEITQECGDYIFGHNIQIMHGASGSPVFDQNGQFAGLIVSGMMYGDVIATGYNFGVLPYKASEFAK